MERQVRGSASWSVYDVDGDGDDDDDDDVDDDDDGDDDDDDDDDDVTLSFRVSLYSLFQIPGASTKRTLEEISRFEIKIKPNKIMEKSGFMFTNARLIIRIKFASDSICRTQPKPLQILRLRMLSNYRESLGKLFSLPGDWQVCKMILVAVMVMNMMVMKEWVSAGQQLEMTCYLEIMEQNYPVS